MKHLLFALALCLLAVSARCQYYYNDIVAARASQQQYLLLKQNNIRNVTAMSYESDGQPTENFKLEQQIGAGAKMIVIYASFPSSVNTITTNFYDDNKLVRTIDSTEKVSTTSFYEYDASGRTTSIRTVTNDTFMNSRSEEIHQWHYTNDKPSLMFKIKDKADTTTIELIYDEQGNVAQENWKKKGRTIERYYYYYNDQKELTDIVRFNNRAQKLLPDFLYEYDAIGRISQMTQVPAGSANYLVWKYAYNDKGLKQSEVCTDKQGQLVGKIEYNYR